MNDDPGSFPIWTTGKREITALNAVRAREIGSALRVDGTSSAVDAPDVMESEETGERCDGNRDWKSLI